MVPIRAVPIVVVMIPVVPPPIWPIVMPMVPVMPVPVMPVPIVTVPIVAVPVTPVPVVTVPIIVGLDQPCVGRDCRQARQGDLRRGDRRERLSARRQLRRHSDSEAEQEDGWNVEEGFHRHRLCPLVCLPWVKLPSPAKSCIFEAVSLDRRTVNQRQFRANAPSRGPSRGEKARPVWSWLPR